MEKVVTLNLVGKCSGCVHELKSRMEEPCLFCERNDELVKLLEDKYSEGEAEKPEPPDGFKEPPNPNVKFLKEWGIEL